MDVAEPLPALSIGCIVVVVLLSGPYGVVDFTPDTHACAEDVFPGRGNASVDVRHSPDAATLARSRFGAAVYRLQVPPARVIISDVAGRPVLSYRLRIDDLATEVGSTVVLSTCTEGERDLTIQQASFEPHEVQQNRYDATLFVVYHGIEDGQKFERALVTKNVTVEVER